MEHNAGKTEDFVTQKKMVARKKKLERENKYDETTEVHNGEKCMPVSRVSNQQQSPNTQTFPADFFRSLSHSQ